MKKVKLKDLAPKSERCCSIQFISEQTGHSVEQLQGDSRKEDIAFMRFICITCLYRIYHIPNDKIGTRFNRHRTTVVASIKAFDNLLKPVPHPKLLKAMKQHKCFG